MARRIRVKGTTYTRKGKRIKRKGFTYRLKGKGVCPHCKKPVYRGGEKHNDRWWHKVCWKTHLVVKGELKPY
jgi:hypothetical protein